jgi:hypothetical protein
MTKKKMEGQTKIKTEQAWCNSCPVADDDDDDDDDNDENMIT